MRFADPVWLEIGAVATVVVALVLARAERLKSRAIARLAGARVRRASGPTPSRLRRWACVLAATLAIAMVSVALARPQIGKQWETMDRRGADVLLVVDTSRSMDADDVKPTRLERAKLAIRDLVERVPEDRVGLVAFAGDAVLASPMTLDHGALLESVDALDTSVVGRGGTDIARALEVAMDALATEPEHRKSIVLLSDGEELEGEAVAAAKKAEAQAITIDTIGIGSAAGELVPAKDARGAAVGVVRDEAGAPVRSKLVERTLRAVADAAHGTYRPLGADGRGLERLYAEVLEPRKRVEASARTRQVYAERFQVPLAIALAALVGHALFAVPRRRRSTSSPGSRRRAAGVAVGAAVLALVGMPSRADASVSAAERAFSRGHYDAAHDLYEAESAKRPADAVLSFNAGDAAYRAGRFDAARAAFDRALRHADPKLQRDILYNQGNALFRLGEGTVKTARARTAEHWKAAIRSYEGALALDGGDPDARHNLEIVKRRLAALEQEQEQEQKPAHDPRQRQDEQQQTQGQEDEQPQQGQPKPEQAQPQEGQPKQPERPNGAGERRDDEQAGGAGKQDRRLPEDGRPEKDGDGRAKPNARERERRDGQEGPRDAGGSALSEDEARALLGTLKGEERRGRPRPADADRKQEEPPRKDW